jgi:hypothetical protein
MNVWLGVTRFQGSHHDSGMNDKSPGERTIRLSSLLVSLEEFDASDLLESVWKQITFITFAERANLSQPKDIWRAG